MYNHEDENTQDIEVYSIAFDPNDVVQMEAMQEFMNAQAEAFNDETQKLQASLSLLYQHDLSWDCAVDVLYLRSRSRWTEALEAELIRLHIANNPPNICEWP